MGNTNELEGMLIPEIPPETEAVTLPPWELIDKGRYMPRRIRGSFRGRELG